jgi:hypothetical protein
LFTFLRVNDILRIADDPFGEADHPREVLREIMGVSAKAGNSLTDGLD